MRRIAERRVGVTAPRSLIAFTLGCAAWGLALPAAAAPAAGGAQAEAPAGDLRAWLMRIHEAARRRNFQGTFVVSGGGAVSSARIAHFCEGGAQFERIDSLDGQARHVFRHNEIVHTVWPSRRLAVVERSRSLLSFPALLQGGDDRIGEFYEVRAEGAGRVAGHESDVLRLAPRDAHRYGYRLWADKGTGLLLRAEALGGKGEVLETSAFSEVVIGIKAQPELVLQPMKRLDGLRVFRPVFEPTSFEAEGWALRDLVPGFRQVSCVRRSMAMDAAAADAAAKVVQAIYSDGLTHVSLFIEPYDERRHAKPMLASVGATHTLMRRHGEWWVTIVGDVPAATLTLFANSLERRK